MNFKCGNFFLAFQKWNIVWKAQLDDGSKGEYDDEKHVQFAHISLVHLLIINKDDKSMLN